MCPGGALRVKCSPDSSSIGAATDYAASFSRIWPRFLGRENGHRTRRSRDPLRVASGTPPAAPARCPGVAPAPEAKPGFASERYKVRRSIRPDECRLREMNGPVPELTISGSAPFRRATSDGFGNWPPSTGFHHYSWPQACPTFAAGLPTRRIVLPDEVDVKRIRTSAMIVRHPHEKGRVAKLGPFCRDEP